MIFRFFQKELTKTSNHLKDVNMSYIEHFIHSSKFSILFFNASLKALSHAIIPSTYLTSSTDLIKKLQTQHTNNHTDKQKDNEN